MSAASPIRSSPLAAFLARRGCHYGWLVVGATFLAMLVTAGTVGTPGVLLVPLQAEFGWSNADISSSFAIRLLLFGLMGPFAAAFMNRLGMRPVVVTALVVMACAVAGSLFMHELWQLQLLWGAVVGAASGFSASVFGATVATRWFVRRRGLVLGLLTASTATGQLVFLPLLAALVAGPGWRTALVPVLALLGVACLGVLTLLRERPADLGLAPYGAPAPLPPPARSSLGEMLAVPLVVLRAAARTRVFWLLFGTFFVCGATTNGLIQTHFIALCADHDMAPTLAADMLAAIGIFDFFGTVGSGWLSDRMSARRLLFWYYALRGLALLGLPFSHFTIFGLSPFVVFYGLDWVATVPPTVKLANEHFGERANVVFGWVFAGHQIGAACAAWGAGLTRTLYESYLPAFVVAGSLCLLAALALALARETPPEVPATFAPEGVLR